MKIMDKEMKLNDLVELGFINKNGYWQLAMGRLYNWDNHYVYLDMSPTFVELDDIIKIKRDKVKYVRKVENDLMWR